MTFHGLRSQLLSQATNSEFINACTEWLCKQCLLQTTSTMTPRGVKDTWDKRVCRGSTQSQKIRNDCIHS